MKILHINTWDTGGAANAAKRLFRAQRKRGIAASFLSLKSESSQKEDLESYQSFIQRRYGQFLAKGLVTMNRIYNQIPIKFNQNLFFNRPESLYKVHKHPLVQQADIIHLHAIVKFIDFPSFFKAVQKPFVWTLHDMNPFSGGMHYLSSPKRARNLERLEKKFIKIKKKAIQGHQFHITAPSLWLKALSEKSFLFSSFPHDYVPNCIDEHLFKRIPNRRADDRMKILFVAQNVEDPRKGFQYLLESLKYLSANVEVLVLGKVNAKEKFHRYSNLTFLGYISTLEELPKLYSSVDLHVITSVEDNAPNTIAESHMCGTPVVGFKTGGISDMISHKCNGILVDSISGKALAEGIQKALQMVKHHKFSEAEIMKKSHAQYSEKRVTDDFNTIYTTLLQR